MITRVWLEDENGVLTPADPYQFIPVYVLLMPKKLGGGAFAVTVDKEWSEKLLDLSFTSSFWKAELDNEKPTADDCIRKMWGISLLDVVRNVVVGEVSDMTVVSTTQLQWKQRQEDK